MKLSGSFLTPPMREDNTCPLWLCPLCTDPPGSASSGHQRDVLMLAEGSVVDEGYQAAAVDDDLDQVVDEVVDARCAVLSVRSGRGWSVC